MILKPKEKRKLLEKMEVPHLLFMYDYNPDYIISDYQRKYGYTYSHASRTLKDLCEMKIFAKNKSKTRIRGCNLAILDEKAMKFIKSVRDFVKNYLEFATE